MMENDKIDESANHQSTPDWHWSHPRCCHIGGQHCGPTQNDLDNQCVSQDKMIQSLGLRGFVEKVGVDQIDANGMENHRQID